MMSADAVALTVLEIPERQSAQWPRLARRGEDLAVSLSLGAMVLLPLAEIVLRKAFHTGISGSTAFVQHLCLVVGMLGGAIAAREKRLLALSTLGGLLKGRVKTFATVLAGSIATAITAFLTIASVQFVLAEKGAGETLAYGIPTWAVELALPAGFGLVTLRLLWYSAEGWKSRIFVAVLTLIAVVVCTQANISPESLKTPALIALLVATVIGAPVFVTLGGAALILFWGMGQPIAAIPLDHYRQVTNPSLPAIPLFTLAGYFLAEGGASKRLIRVFQAFVGPFRGGPAIVTALVCAFFTSFTGASGVTILALGGLLLPVLLAAKYSEDNALGLLTGAGSLGLLFPPCLPLILYAIVAKIPIEQIFLAGILPGALMVGLTAWLGICQGAKERSARPSFNGHEAGASVWEAKWELLLPVVALVGIFGGFATVVEASALTALYAFIAETFIHRDLNFLHDVPRVMTECGLLVGGVLLILGVALGLTDYMVVAEIPARAVEWVTGSIHSEWVFLLLLNLFLLVIGCLMDIYSAIVVQVPLLVPIAAVFHVNPVHLGIIFLANMEIGYMTPPVGLNLFLSSYRFNKPLGKVMRATMPLAGVLLLAVLLITYFPWLTTALPRWLGH
jgi:C4-dicarboxylate transporter, DctM subunit